MHQSRPPKEPPREFIQAQLDLRVRGEIPEEEAMTLLANLQVKDGRSWLTRLPNVIWLLVGRAVWGLVP